jgi:hypothetical protein
MTRFEDWSYNDTDYGGLKGRATKQFSVYHIIELINFPEATGDLIDGKTYWVELGMVDVMCVDPRCLTSALRDCGPETFQDDEETDRLAICAESLWSYGCHGRLGSWTGNNAERLLIKARKLSKELENDLNQVSDLLEVQANQMGNSWRDFMVGFVGFSRAQHEMRKRGESLVKDYATMLEKRLAEREAEIRDLESKLSGVSSDLRAVCS